MSEPLRLHLGCGRTYLDGWVNCDLAEREGVDAAFDVQQKWPFQDDSVVAIYAAHLLEHLTDPRAFFREAWRVMQPEGAQMLLRLPYGGHRSAWWDLEHVRPWFAETFCFLQPGYARAIGNPEHDGWSWPFDVAMVRLRLGSRAVPLIRRKWLRRWLGRYAMELLDNTIEELWVDLVPLKTERALAIFGKFREPNIVPVSYVVYKHHLEGRSVGIGQPTELVPVAEGEVLNGFGQIGE